MAKWWKKTPVELINLDLVVRIKFSSKVEQPENFRAVSMQTGGPSRHSEPGKRHVVKEMALFLIDGKMETLKGDEAITQVAQQMNVELPTEWPLT